MNQRGFATLEVILMVVIIGILATVAVPRFTDVTTKANTAKIQSDLTTIDTALQMYYMEHGNYEGISNVADLTTKKYLMSTPTPPTGSAMLNGTSKKINDTTKYELDTSDNSNYRAKLSMDSNTNAHAEDFSITAKSTTTNEG